MATSLYEILGIPTDASPEQIRKAYKKKALITHPDRLPPTATDDDKRAAEEQFRQVNNAYEVLNDPQNRQTYDLHGVWPPPQPEPNVPHRQRSYSHHYRPPRGRTFSEPFFGRPFHPFTFTDPFAMFASVFGDHPLFPSFHHGPHSASPWREDPFERAHRMHDFLTSMERDLFSDMGGGFFDRHHPPALAFPSSFDQPWSSQNRGQVRWAKESMVTSTVNGVTQSTHKVRDWDGNEHVRRRLPDGREVYTINGVEQPPSGPGFLPQPPPIPKHSHRSDPRADYLTPPPSYHSSYGHPPPVPPNPDHKRRRIEARYDQRPVIPDAYPPHSAPVIPDVTRFEDGESHRKRWWRG